MAGKELRVIRERLGLTQEAFSEHIATTRNTVARWERGDVRIPDPVAKLIRIVSVVLEPRTPRSGKKGAK